MSDSAIPQWKKDLIARLRNQNRRTAQQLFAPSQSGPERCECNTMVQQERSSDDEDLHYGPGIVNKLKERYLSLAQRDKPSRPSVLRKAASLENLLDDAPEQSRLFQPGEKRSAPKRYAKRANGELKRARSVETISSTEEREDKEPKRESLHEEMLIANRGSSVIIPEKPVENVENAYVRINRPKRIAPVMNEREKPPADVVKQAKMIFERRPEQRTKQPQQTGEVAAKVATYKNIIVQNKPKKPVLKVKPVINDKPKTNGIRIKTKTLDRDVKVERPKSPADVPRPKSPLIRPKSPVDAARPKSPQHKITVDIPCPKSPEKQISVDVPPSPKSPTRKFPADLPSPRSPKLEVSADVPSPKSPEKTASSLPSPIPDISRVDFKVEENGNKSTSLTETPDLIVTSSPLPVVNSPSFRISATENFIKEEIRLSQTERSPTKPNSPSEDAKKPPPSPPSGTATATAPNSMTFNFAKTSPKPQNHLPVNKNVLNTQTPPSQPLKLEINGVNETKRPPSSSSSSNEETALCKTSQGQVLVSAKPTLTTLEIEKNLINAAKTLEQPKNNSVAAKCENEVNAIKVPKVKRPPRELENNTIVFNFTDRKDVPDYVHNDGVKRVAKLEKPKVGEGGFILLSSVDPFAYEDEELMRSLEGPPSPCDVTFINDNILIDGKSSLREKTKKAKLKISFLEEGPEVYEYPSESSLLVEEAPVSPPSAQVRHSAPSVTGGSSLANYTPKSMEEFQPGVTRSVQNAPTNKPESSDTSELTLQEVERPIMFSAGANTDILF